MATFKYTAVDRGGKKTNGSVSAQDMAEAKSNVRKMGLRVLQLKETKSGGGKKKLKLSEINLTPPKAKPDTLVRFFRQLATMLDAGIQLIDSLEILEQQMELQDKVFAKALTKITEDVKTGIQFSDALSEHKNIFSVMTVSMIRAAEAGGGLDTIIDHIATFIEKEADTKKKIKSATSYPKFVGGFFMVILMGIIFGLLPKFQDIFADLGAELPLPTRIIIFTSNMIKDNLLVVIVLIVAITAGLKAYGRTPKGRINIDRYSLRIPISGDLYKKSILVRFTLTLSILLNAGVGLIDALKIAGKTAENAYVDNIIIDICDNVSSGESMGKMLGKYPEIFPALESNMITVGERSGSLTLMLEKVSEFNDLEFSAKVENLSNILEPVIMGFLGVVATILVLGLYLPIFKMSGSIH